MMNGELLTKLKKHAVTYFKALNWHLAELIEEHDYTSQGNHLPARNQ
jgi:hypothetical protein